MIAAYFLACGLLAAGSPEDIPPASPTYMGRTIAQTMHYCGAEWLTRGSRSREEGTRMLLKELAVEPGTVICDMGCGNGFYTVPLAQQTGADGRVYAVEIQPEMLEFLGERTREAGLENIVPVLGTVIDPKLPDASIDLMLLVDVYHEMSHPEHMLAAMRRAMKPDGRMVLLEFRAEDPAVPIKPLHKMSKAQVLKELTANGFALSDEYDDLPWQHMMTFRKAPLPTQVFILAGQSNMEGHGVVDLDHPEYYNGGRGTLEQVMEATPDRYRHLRGADGAWTVRDDVRVRYVTGSGVKDGGLTIGFSGYEGAHHIGPELGFGHVVGDAVDAPVLLVKTAWGGKSLMRDFRPPSAEGETGPYYEQMLAEVRAALAAIDGPYEIAGFVWQQGWNDMVDSDARAEYAANLEMLAADIRTEFDAADLPIVVGELGNGGDEAGREMREFRAAQRAGAARIEGAVFVPTTMFARPAQESPNVGHGHHWFGNAESYYLVGDALGRAMVELLD